jgi:adenylate cyclase
MPRRLAAIMFTDIAGYTSLSQTDEPAALHLLRDQNRLVRGLLEVHRGRLVKSMGDGLLIEFANALDAVQCAMDLQRHIQERNAREPPPPLQVRIGIHLGDVEGAGSDILGDAVNLASRIEPLTEPGGVCLTESVYLQVRNKVPFPLEKMGPKNLKGIREPVEVYRAVVPSGRVDVTPGGPLPRRLAVLPLTNMSPDPSDEYFADGLTEEIISTVSKVPELSVISRTSVMGYKTQTKPIAVIGRELGAGTILEGSVRKAGNRIRVAVQLIDAVGDRHLWAENFDRSLDDIFAIQSEIAQQVADALKIRLPDSDKGRIAKAPTEVAEANLLFMKGLFHFERMTKEELETAIVFFEQAVQKDPRYAPAHAGIAGAYGVLGTWEVIPPQEAYARAERAAKTALELDASLALAHMAIAGAHEFRGEPKEARESLERALALDPSLSGAHAYAGLFYLRMGWTERAIAEAQTAAELDPLNPNTIQVAANVLLFGGRPELAYPLTMRTVELDPKSALGRNNLGLCYLELGNFEEGLEEVRKAVETSGRKNPVFLACLAYALNRAGRSVEAREIVAELLENHQKRGTGVAAIACAYASVGDADRAFEWLDKAFQEGSLYARTFMLDFGFRTLSADPRFQKFLEKVRSLDNR